MNTSRIAIVGGGIGGLCTALGLLQRGIDVDIYEQASELREVGAGIQMSANGSRVLHALGLADALDAVAAHPASKEVRLWNTGRSWKLFELGAQSVSRYGYPYLMLHRADLLAVLASAVRACKPGAIHLGRRLAAFHEQDGQVQLRFEDGTTAAHDGLIGADGVHSRVRRGLFGEDAPVFTGCLAWRGLVPMAELPQHLRRPVGTNWVGPGAHVVHYPVRQGSLLNFVGIVERSDWQVESWTVQGTTDECARDFAGWHPDIHEIIRRLQSPHKWALMVREPLQRWSRGRVTLLGDACHATLPFLAQGAMMAIEDGMVLARCVQAHREDLAQAFFAFESLRSDRTARIVRGSAENAKRFHAHVLSSEDDADAYVSTEWSEEKVKQRYDWLFEYDATSVEVQALAPQTGALA